MANSDAQLPLTRADLRYELEHYATKADMADLKADLNAMETRLIKWMLGIMVGSIAVASTIALLIQRLID